MAPSQSSLKVKQALDTLILSDMKRWSVFNSVVVACAFVLMEVYRYTSNSIIVMAVGFLLLLVFICSTILYTFYGMLTRVLLPKLSIAISRPYRDLKKEEQNILIMKNSDDPTHSNEKNMAIFIMILSLLPVMGFGMLLITSRITLSQIGPLSPFLVVTVLCILYAHYRYDQVAHNSLELDITSPVYMIQGQVINDFRMRDEKYDFKVGKYGFTYANTRAPLSRVAQNLQEGEDVTIEFSPHTHFIWNIEKMA